MRDTDLARELLSSADKDLRAIKHMADPNIFADEVFGFHAQQAVEKTLKAWIALLGQEYPFIHDLDVLLNRLENQGSDVSALRALVELNAFAVQFRYEAFESQDEPLDRPAVAATVDRLFQRVSLLLSE